MAKKNLVNWSDCMPLSAAIFNQHDDYFLDSVRDSIEVRTNSYNYGLLPARQNRDGENGIRISQHVTGHIEVRLNPAMQSPLRVSVFSLMLLNREANW